MDASSSPSSFDADATTVESAAAEVAAALVTVAVDREKNHDDELFFCTTKLVVF